MVQIMQARGGISSDALHFKNLLLNPDGRINQEAPASNADDTYAHDQWYALTQTSTIALSTVSDAENGTPEMWRLTQSQASAQRMGYAQIIEGANCKHLRGKTVTLGGRIKFSLNAAVRYAILEWTSTEDSVTSDVVNDWTSGTYTASNFFLASNLTITGVGSITPAAATLTDITPLTVTLGSSFNNLIVFMWTEGTAAQNATLDGALQLEEGGRASKREIRPYSIEFGMCQRYYFQTAVFGCVGTVFTASAIARMSGPLPCRMRVTPTITPSGVGYFDGAGTSAFSSVGADYSTPDTYQQDINTAGGLTVGRPAVAYNPSASVFKFNARL